MVVCEQIVGTLYLEMIVETFMIILGWTLITFMS